jgi:hypothetical protein
MANTLSTKTYRDKYRKAALEVALRNGLVTEKICEVDRSDAKTIQAPYQTAPTVIVQALSGTYTPAEYVITDDTLTVADEFIVSEHVFDFENTLAKFDLFAARTEDMTYAVMASIDKFVLNVLCEDGTGAYTTPAGGFTTASNINVIMSNLLSKVAGFSEMYNGTYLVIENTDVPGFVQAQATNGFSYADMALNNGFIGNYMGVDIYVVRTGTFVTATIGTRSDFSNAGHRVFGVKKMATYAAPRGIQFEEKGVAGKTGKEIVAYGYIGAKVWTPKATLTVDITLA